MDLTQKQRDADQRCDEALQALARHFEMSGQRKDFTLNSHRVQLTLRALPLGATSQYPVAMDLQISGILNKAKVDAILAILRRA